MDYTYLGAPVTWKAWGSTQSTSAASNLGAWHSTVDVWRNDGTTKISTGGNFFTTNHSAAVQDFTNSTDRVWSGSYADGSAVPNAWLGRASGQGVQNGFCQGTVSVPNWATFEQWGAEAELTMYGVSSELTVGVVPEPSTYAITAFATTGLAGVMRWRKRRVAKAAG